VALHGVALEHRLKAAAAASIVQNWTLIVVRCRGLSAVTYLLNYIETEPNGSFGVLENRTEPSL